MEFFYLAEILKIGEARVFLGVLILTFAIYFLFKKVSAKSYNLPPGPIGLPIVGYLPFLGKLHHETLYKLSQKHGSVISFYLGQTLCISCNDWPSAEEALSKTETLDRPGVFDLLPNSLGVSGANGKNWTEQRRFSTKTMRDVGLGRPQWGRFLQVHYLFLIQEEVNEIIEQIRNSNGQTLDIRETFSVTFTNNIMTLLFGKRLPANHPVNITINDSLDYLAEQFAMLSSFTFLPRLCGILNMIGLYGSKKSLQKLSDFNKCVIKYVDKEMAENTIDQGSFVALYHKEVEQQKSNPNTFITKGSFYGNTESLIFGGTDTTRTAMVWLLMAVAKHSEVQHKIHKELDSILGTDGKILWSEHHKIPYTFSTIMESLRWRSLTPLGGLRMTNSDIKIQGYDVPKGTYIVINAWALHNDPKYWPEPEEFQPERFLKNEGKQINNSPESFAPFSYGRRNCPGKMIALMELFEYFVTIMQNFTVMPPENGFEKIEILYGLTYQAKSMKLRFIPR